MENTSSLSQSFIRRGYDSSYSNEVNHFQRMHYDYDNKLFNTSTKLQIVDSHNAYPRYDQDNDCIILDTHFLDILQMVSASVICNKPEWMDAIANLCIADCFIVKDDIHLALIYSNLYKKQKEEIEDGLLSSKESRKRIFDRQLLFVLSHEQGHGLINNYNASQLFETYEPLFEKELIIRNEISTIINNLDLSPILEDLNSLDKHKIENSYNYSPGEFILAEGNTLDFFQLISKVKAEVEIPKTPYMKEELIIYHAIDNYLKNTKTAILNRETYRDDSVIDGNALQQIIDYGRDSEDFLIAIEDSLFAYCTCLLTINLIKCVKTNIAKIGYEGYSIEDLTWCRFMLERGIINHILDSAAYSEASKKPLFDYFYDYYAKSIFEVAELFISLYQLYYGRFCDYAFTVKHPDENDPICSMISKEYINNYNIIRKNLTTKHI